MATVVSQYVRHIGRLFGFLENFILRKIASNFTEISGKHVFAASNKNITKNRVKLEQIFFKTLQFSISNFDLHN